MEGSGGGGGEGYEKGFYKGLLEGSDRLVKGSGFRAQLPKNILDFSASMLNLTRLRPASAMAK